MNLDDPVIDLKYINDKYTSKLSKLGIETIKDLITHFPRDYSDSSEISTIADILFNLDETKEYTIKCNVTSVRSARIKFGKTIQTAKLVDSTGEIKTMWFNQPYLEKTFANDPLVLFNGKVKRKGKAFQFYPKTYDLIIENRENIHLGRISPEYKLTEGVTKKWFRNRIKQALDLLEGKELNMDYKFLDYVDKEDLIKNFVTAHFPKDEKSLEKSVEDLSMLELTNLNLKILRKVKKKSKNKIIIDTSNLENQLDSFLKLLSFEPTKDQLTVIKRINELLKANNLINSLLQGDVGSGKTLIAAYLSYIMALNGYQTIILAPTTILASQHYNTFTALFKDIKTISVELVTGLNKDTKPKDILIGTSAILKRKESLIIKPGLLIVDEQHRFGVEQREELLKPFSKDLETKLSTPHFLNITATPIPRTIIESLFSDIEVFTLKTKPKGRLPIKTHIVSNEKRENSFQWINQQVNDLQIQAYWICPLIEESDTLEIKSAKKIFEEVKNKLTELKVELLHGKMKENEKKEIMERFQRNEIQILVSTTVIEVGVDVPNATILFIESAERFGLAQLHQIRGRIGRGDKQSYCFLCHTEEISEKAQNRLEFITQNNDGQEIAEFDLQQRGPGEVYGTRQSGIPNLKIAKLNDIGMLKQSKELALSLHKRGITKIDLFE